MDITAALDLARTTSHSVLVTLRGNGRPQLSNVLHSVDDEGTVRVSITTDRAKYKNLSREPWAALHVTRQDFWAWVVLEGEVELSPPAAAAKAEDATVEELVEHYRRLRGEHEDWDEFRRAQITEQRVMVRLRPTRAYGML